MGYRSAAVLVVVIHLAFVAFILAGGFLAWRWRRLLPLHALAAVTSGALAITGLDCPLTDLEKWLRRLAGDEPYAGGFIAHYLVQPVSGAAMTPELHMGLRVFTVAVVAAAYGGALLLRSLTFGSRSRGFGQPSDDNRSPVDG